MAKSRPVRALWIEMYSYGSVCIYKRSRPVRALWIEIGLLELILLYIRVEAREGLVD